MCRSAVFKMGNNLYEEYYSELIIWDSIFDVIHTRGRVGFESSITYIIHTNEVGPHHTPHLHARYNQKEIVISLVDFQVLAGNLPGNKSTQACQWVKEHQDFLMKHWIDFTLGVKTPV